MSKEYTTELLLDFGADGNQLVPVVTQDIHTGQVLILAYVNQDAFRETINSGYATFYSRSRKEIWKKGSTSGDYLKVEEIRINCEQNSLLFRVHPVGKGVCHAKNSKGESYGTCFYRKLNQGKLEITE